MKKGCTSLLLLFLALTVLAQETDTLQTKDLQGVTVAARRHGTTTMSGALNGSVIHREELFRAACCNLGESFTTNPSVVVSYSDAATGAKQIRLLGLSGTYVQMLTENLPDFRGAASPFSLDYVPGTWMQSIQVSKGVSSVRNGFESITGQIDVEYLKPDDDEGVTANLYANTKSRVEANAEGNIHLGDPLSTELMVHFQHDWGHPTDRHGLSAGLSILYDYLGQRLAGTMATASNETETTSGLYVQYTYTLADRLTAMAGARVNFGRL